MSISETQVRRVATLARLHLTDEETAALAADLSRILQYVDKLAGLDTSAVEPTSHVVLNPAAWREDVVTSGDDPEAAVANAPRREGHYFAVPRILE